MADALQPSPAAPERRPAAPNKGRSPRQRAAAGSPATPPRAKAGPAPRSHPLLDALAQHYPLLFGDPPLPLKRGIFEDLQAAQPALCEREALKAALALHTRSSRYLTAVAAGQQRHDLAGQPVEALAPEHIYHALLEIFRRRQQRSAEDLGPKLRRRIVEACEASGLSRSEYAQRMRSQHNTAANAVLDEAMSEAASRAARDEALLRAFEASGLDVAAFAGQYGLHPKDAAQTLERARRRAAPPAP